MPLVLSFCLFHTIIQMKYNEFSKQIWNSIEQQLIVALDEAKAQKTRPVAVFDADGTLWDTDLGESFFQYQISEKLVPLPPDAFNFYLELKKKNNDPREAYLWLAQINNGVQLKQVRQWAEDSVKKNSPLPIFVEQKKVIELFLQNNVEVYIVTASIKWAVEPGALRLGLKESAVLGVETYLDDQDRVTIKQKGQITYKQGKLDRLLQVTNGRMPFFASGNTTGDISLLEAATKVALAVCAADKDSRLFSSEQELQQIAKEKNWLRHNFRS